MSSGTEPQPNVQLIEETRKQINRLIEEVARLSESDMSPPDYYAEFLKRVLAALTAPAAAVWGRTAQGNLQLQYQMNMRQVGLDRSQESRESHDQLLRRIVNQPQSLHLPPHSSAGKPEAGFAAPGNPTDYMILLVPIVVDNQVAGLVEVWQSPDRHPNAVKGFLQFLTHMSELASRFTRNHLLRQMVGQQQVWTQMEAFARQIHGSLHPVEVSYLIVNEARRLINCDRVSIALRYGKRVAIEAISGADVVEKRSSLVQLMRKLSDRVLRWGDKLVFTGTKDDSLPPDVLEALDLYLAESNSKLLVILPLRDERESENKKPARSALLMESFEPPLAPEQMIARLEVIGRHATSALYNAVEHRRIPMRFIWLPLAKIQEGLGGKARAIIVGIVAGVAALIGLMTFVPYQLKMDANGKLLPVTRPQVYSTSDARIYKVDIKPAEQVQQGQNLVLMRDPHLEMQLNQLAKEIKTADGLMREFEFQLQDAPPDQRPRIDGDYQGQRILRESKEKERNALIELHNADEEHPGYFWLKAPEFPPQKRDTAPRWTVLNEDFQDYTNKWVKPSDPLIRLGDVDGPWEIELKIPQKHIGQILYAYEANHTDTLDVDLLVRSDPTRKFKGKLMRDRIGGQANPNKEETTEAEPIVLAYVTIDGHDIPKEYSIPSERHLLVAGTEVHVKVRCGNHALGYSLFYGVWEFFYERVVFWF